MDKIQMEIDSSIYMCNALLTLCLTQQFNSGADVWWMVI